jgi:hypothetical protein
MFLSLMLILGAAFVALICDHLKRNNEQLRELAIEINVRRQEEYKRFRMLAPQSQKAIEPAPAPRSSPAATEVPAPAMQTVRMRVSPPKPPSTGAPPTTPPSAARSLDLPVGFHDGHVLTRLVQQRQPVRGLVISIGVNAPRNPDGSLGGNVQLLIETLLGPGDFAAQSGEEEFLLIFPTERGVSAQRRLSEVAQELWDFQLNSRETCSILFSWAGVEVDGEPIEVAIESASERMQETRRSRKVRTMESLAV